VCFDGAGREGRRRRIEERLYLRSDTHEVIGRELVRAEEGSRREGRDPKFTKFT
jgi:hypothetical protein